MNRMNHICAVESEVAPYTTLSVLLQSYRRNPQSKKFAVKSSVMGKKETKIILDQSDDQCMVELEPLNPDEVYLNVFIRV